MTVDIYIREKNGTREIRVPILPEDSPFHNGDTIFATHDIMGLGEVSVPTGTELGAYSWESVFPGELRKNDSLIRGPWIDPKTYNSILNDWKKNGTKLNLLVIGYPINVDVYLKEYHGAAAGAFGDIKYEIAFIEARDIVVTTSKVETTAKRSTTTGNTYTIKTGDTLWEISIKFYGTGTKWKTIYDANKDIIESTAKKRGKSSSNNGWWIFPGVTLTIPKASGSASASSGSGSGGTTAPSTKAPTASSNGNGVSYLDERNEGIDKMVNSIKNSGKNAASNTRDQIK